MKIFDEVYLIIYWVVNKKLNPQKTTIWALNYLLFPPLTGFLVFVSSLFLLFIQFSLSLKFLILISVLISFFLSGSLIERYFTKEKQKAIIDNNNKSGIYRYFIFIFLILFSIVMMVLFAFLAGIILNR